MISKLQKYIEDQEFETDSIQMDIEEQIGNIADELKDSTIMLFITRFVKNNKS